MSPQASTGTETSERLNNRYTHITADGNISADFMDSACSSVVTHLTVRFIIVSNPCLLGFGCSRTRPSCR